MGLDIGIWVLLLEANLCESRTNIENGRVCIQVNKAMQNNGL